MIQLAAQHWNEIANHGERDYPHECCGLLLGQFAPDGTKIVSEIYPISNAREEAAKRNRFLITPDELLRGERYAAGQKLETVGFYHSHPDHPAVPSRYDQDHALPVYSYVIVSVQQALARGFRSWTLRADRTHFDEESVLKGN
jgi:proteasome lid subunit RPN8/RPN11